jgi:CRISPR/Cas system CMR-associated protein Cmr3 (group 5 of RAMP superfamily)
MHIAKIIKKEKKVGLVFCDKDLKVLEEESFEDVYSLNFFLQTLPRKYDVEKTLMIVHDQRLNMVDIQIASGENSYYIT